MKHGNTKTDSQIIYNIPLKCKTVISEQNYVIRK